MDWFLYDMGLRRERANLAFLIKPVFLHDQKVKTKIEIIWEQIIFNPFSANFKLSIFKVLFKFDKSKNISLFHRFRPKDWVLLST